MPRTAQVQPTPFGEKLHAIAYVNSNCGAQSGRAEIMRKLMALGDKAKVGRAVQWWAGSLAVKTISSNRWRGVRCAANRCPCTP
jgi:hypothetical protein